MEELKSLFDDITSQSRLATLKLQTCWQIARVLGVPYETHYTANTVRSIIRNLLFPDDQDESVDKIEESDSLISQLSSTPQKGRESDTA